MADAVVKTAIVAETGSIQSDLQALQNAFKRLEAQVNALDKENKKLTSSLERTQTATKSVQSDTESMSSSFEGLGKQAGALAAAYLSIDTALTVMKGAIASTQATADAFDVAMAQVDAGVNHFYQTIANGNWDSFFDGLVEATAKAKGLQEQLDLLADVKVAYQWGKSEKDREFEEAKEVIKNPNASKAEKAKAKARVEQLGQELIRESSILAEETKTTIRKMFSVSSGNMRFSVPEIEEVDYSAGAIAGRSGGSLPGLLGGVLTGRSVSTKAKVPNRDAERILKNVKLSSDFNDDEIGYIMTKVINGRDAQQEAFNKRLKELERKASQSKQDGVAYAKFIEQNQSRARIYAATNNLTDEDRSNLLQYKNEYEQSVAQANAYKSKVYRLTKGDESQPQGQDRPVPKSKTSASEKVFEEGSIAKAEQDLQKVRKAFNEATDGSARAILEGKIRMLQELIKQMKDYAESEYLGNEHRRKQQESDTAIHTVEGKTKTPAIREAKTLTADIGKTIKGRDDNLKKIQGETNAYREQGDVLNDLAGVMSTFAGATDGAASSMLQWGVSVLSAISQALPQIAALTTAQTTQAGAAYGAAVAKSASTASILGPIATIAAIGSVVAAIASVPKFERGGVVSGSSYYGDKILARVNSGELILNQKQQQIVYEQMRESRNASLQNVQIDITPEVRIKGQDLIMVMRRTERSLSRH